MRTTLAFAVTFTTIVALASSSAHAQQDPATAAPPAAAPGSAPTIQTTGRSPGETSNALTIWGILAGGGYGWGGYGVGGRIMLPVGLPRLLTRTPFKDYWALEFGVDLRTWSFDYGINSRYRWTEILPVGGLMWQFWLRPDFAIYPKVEAGWGIGWYSGYDSTIGARGSYGGIYVDGAAGLLYQVSGGLTLRAEVGYTGLKGGVAWTF